MKVSIDIKRDELYKFLKVNIIVDGIAFTAIMSICLYIVYLLWPEGSLLAWKDNLIFYFSIIMALFPTIAVYCAVRAAINLRKLSKLESVFDFIKQCYCSIWFHGWLKNCDVVRQLLTTDEPITCQAESDYITINNKVIMENVKPNCNRLTICIDKMYADSVEVSTIDIPVSDGGI